MVYNQHHGVWKSLKQFALSFVQRISKTHTTDLFPEFGAVRYPLSVQFYAECSLYTGRFSDEENVRLYESIMKIQNIQEGAYDIICRLYRLIEGTGEPLPLDGIKWNLVHEEMGKERSVIDYYRHWANSLRSRVMICRSVRFALIYLGLGQSSSFTYY
jgi:hypothetical protein